MAKGHDNKGRSKYTERYIALHRYMLKSEAWKSLNAYEKSTFIAIKSRYNGFNNGDISMSVREIATEAGCGLKKAHECVNSLIEKGFLRIEQKGSFDWKMRHDGSKGRRATTWILTDEKQDLPEPVLAGATKDFMKFNNNSRSNYSDEI